MSTASLMSVEEFARMRTADTEDYELVEGELIPLSSGTPQHAEVRDQAGDIIRAYLKASSTGKAFAEIHCHLSARTVRRPDLSIFLGERAKAFDLDQIPVPFAPDIAIEVLSPCETAIEVNRKALDYLSAGTKEVWLLDISNGEVLIRSDSGIRLLRGNDILTSPLLPGFSPALADVLARES